MGINALEWDDENIEHIARHGISPLEVEDICFGLHISIRGRMRRYVLYGKTNGGRYVMVVLERLHRGLFRPITARDMTEREKVNYRRQAR